MQLSSQNKALYLRDSMHALRLLLLLPLRPLQRFMRLLRRFICDCWQYERSHPPESLRIRLRSLCPMLEDADAEAGLVTDYFLQDLWAARKIYKIRPESHVDVGSRLDGFVAHLLVFMPVTYVDIRPLHRIVKNLHFMQTDAVTLEGFADSCAFAELRHLKSKYFGSPSARVKSNGLAPEAMIS
jgi:hypothetical protein